jgi:hypothetical protein
VDVSVFFTGKPYDCAHLKPGHFYLGRYPWSDGGSISTRECRDVTDGPGFRAAAFAHDAREQMVMVIHNDLSLTSADFANWANKGELLVIGLLQANGAPPRINATGVTPFNWHSTSGNFALVNLIKPGEIGVGSAHHPHKQTITLVGITQPEGPGRLMLTRFEGGNAPNDPMLPIDDEVYFKNVLVRAGPNSHNVYLDRNGLQYVEGLISYGNPGDGYHPLKLDGKLVFLYGSWLSSAGVLGVLPNDNSGQSPLSAVACQSGVIQGNHLLDAIDEQGGSAAGTAQIRVAISGCDDPQGFLSNTVPTRPYLGPLNYKGSVYTKTPFWDPQWWAQVRAAGTVPPALYKNPYMLVTYYLDNTFEVLINSDKSPDNYHGLLAQPTFPTSYPNYSQSDSPRLTNAAPPAAWLERARLVVANNCFRGGNSRKVTNHWPPLMACDAEGAPAWTASWSQCADGKGFPDETDKFVMLGQNKCGAADTVPKEVLDAIKALESVPNPPWRSWR